jgi:Putative beta-barrel porin 2
MPSKFPPRVGQIALALLFSIVSTGEVAAKNTSPNKRITAESADRSSATFALAQQVAEIANSMAISKAKKEKRISTTVRVAVVAATAYKKDPDEILGTALELAESAARAAPHFAEVIASAVSFAPSLAKIDSASGRIRTATFAAARAPRNGRKTNVAARKVRQPASLPENETEESADSHVTRHVASEPTERESAVSSDVAEIAEPEETSMNPKVSLGGNSKFSVTADLSVRHDDNVYLTSSNPAGPTGGDKTGDTIIAVTPGVEFRFGQNSLAHGSINYKTAFTRYVDKSAPNVSLGSGSADFGYDNGSLAVSSAASFQQINQNNSDVAALGEKAIYRRDLLLANGSVESHLTGKTSVKTGVNYSKSEYKTPGLNGRQETEIPLKVYLETTPKVSVSAGVAYRHVVPQNEDGATGKDLDYNIGARGNFTAKLNGEFSLDYRTRKVGDNDSEKLWGFNGALNYEITPKTTSSLVFSRDFSAGVLGDSLKNSSYALRLSTDLTPQWLLGAGVTYRQVEYGNRVFRNGSSLPAVNNRSDDYWEGNLQATYLYRSWLSATADFTTRQNSSNLSAAEYSNNVISLILGWRY